MDSTESDDWTILLLLWPWEPPEIPSETLRYAHGSLISLGLKQFRARVSRYAAQMGLQLADAEDLLQDLLLERLLWIRGHVDTLEMGQLGLAFKGANSVEEAHAAIKNLPPHFIFPYSLDLYVLSGRRRSRSRSSRLPTKGLSAAANIAAPMEPWPVDSIEFHEALSAVMSAANRLPPDLAAMFTLLLRDATIEEQADVLRLAREKISPLKKRVSKALEKSVLADANPSVIGFLSKYFSFARLESEPREKRLKGKNGRMVEVWYGTNRVPRDRSQHSFGYLGDPEPEGAIHHGYCRVFVPEGHSWGELHTPLWEKLLTLWRPSGDLKLLSIDRMTEDGFVRRLRRTLDAGAAPHERDLLIYVHGYNVTFEAAAIRAAQLEVDLNAAGATAFFSWPSKGTLGGYLADEEAIRISEKPFLAFVELLYEKVQPRRIHVLVHSMGNRALARLAELFSHLPMPMLGEVVLAAPDVNVIEFKQQARGYKAISSRTTLYASSGAAVSVLLFPFDHHLAAGNLLGQ
jgi:esterase/lipase superfamily enzyme/DNA-directed RNA polymerase specialized sigma24 family protein